MIPAAKSRAFTWWFARHARLRVARSFSRVHVAGAHHALAALARGPVIAVSNHSAWWDPLVVLWLTRALLDAEVFAMMRAENLRRLPFFALVGAFGVDVRDPADGALALRYAARLLSAPGRLVWVFAQGDERPISLRPLGFRRGAAQLSRLSGAVTLPVAIRYEHAEDERPAVYLRVGEPLLCAGDVVALCAAQEAAVAALLDEMERECLAGDRREYEVALARRRGWWGSLAEGILVAITRVVTGIARAGAQE